MVIFPVILGQSLPLGASGNFLPCPGIGTQDFQAFTGLTGALFPRGLYLPHSGLPTQIMTSSFLGSPFVCVWRGGKGGMGQLFSPFCVYYYCGKVYIT